MTTDSVGIIIQARMGSSRLPGKVLKDFCGKTLLGRIIERIGYLSDRFNIVVATSELEQDDVIVEWCKKNDVDCFRGNEKNVLKRYYDCAMEYGFANVVRMTADNPFPDDEELVRLIEFHIKENNDFSENFSQLPIGVGMEIFTMSSLAESMKYASLPKHFEHADEYILDNLEKYKHGTLNVDKEKYFPDTRLTVDTVDDYIKACRIFELLGECKYNTVNIIKAAQLYESEESV